MTDGPFASYPMGSTIITVAGTQLYGTGRPLDELGDDIRWAAAVGEGHTDGVIDGFVEFFGTDLDDRAKACRARAVLGAGAVNRWAGAVATYDAGVDDLNLRYTTAASNGFGIEEPIPHGGQTPDAFDAEWDDYVADRRTAESQLMRTLRAEHQVLGSDLDDEATAVAAVLDAGPSERAFLALFEGGYLPFDVGDLVPGVPFEDTDRFHDESIEQAIEELTEAGRIEGEASAFMRLWVERMVEQGKSVDDIVEMAESEDVSEDTFAALDDAEIVYDPQGRMFVRITDAGDARAIMAATQLMNGALPSTTRWRHEANDFTYDGPLWMDSDVELVLNEDGVLYATPDGTMMSASHNQVFDLPSTADLLSFNGGTTWGDIFVINGGHDDPNGYIRDVIERGALFEGQDQEALERLLHHETIHSVQWAEEGYYEFLLKYGKESVTGGFDPCENSFEEEAGFEDGNYSCN